MSAPAMGDLRQLGRTRLTVSAVCLGGGPLGSMPGLFGYDTPAERGVQTVLAALDSPLRFIDTSAGYTDGESERRIGEALRRAGGLPAEVVLSTKVDPVGGQFNGPAVRRSLEESLERLGLDRVDVLHFHDPERVPFEDTMAADGAVPALVQIRDEGLAGHLGVAGGPASLMARYVDTGAFDVLLTHNRWTLADRSADAVISQAYNAGLGVTNAAPFGGGVLARGTAEVSTYCYGPMNPETKAAIQTVEAICADAGVPLAAAALQFSTRDPRIHSTIVGMSRAERLSETAKLATWPIPDDVWEAVLDASGTDAGLTN